MKKKICLACLTLLTGFSTLGQIAAWDFYGQSLPVTSAATTFNANLVSGSGASNMTRGSGAPASTGVNSFRTTGFQNNGISTASSDYFQITLQAAPGYKLSLSTLDAKFNGTTSFFASPGVTSQFAYSLDGATFILIGNPALSTSLTMTQINLASIADIQNVHSVTTVTLRYYASGQTTTGGWGFYSASAGTNGLAVGGVVSEDVISPPSITSPTASSITPVSAILGGRITVNGGSAITERGTLWKTSSPVTINDHLLAEGGADTGIFAHLRTGLPSATKIYFSAYASNAIGNTLSTESSFFTLAVEPTNHVTNFSAAAGSNTSIDLSWTPVLSGASGYLILQKQGATAPASVPADAIQYQQGVVLGDATVAAIVSNGSTGAQTISALSPGTQYTFTIFPYCWDGTNAETTNYLTNPAIPAATATTSTPSVATYHWTGTVNNDFTNAGNWNPVRTIPALNDILTYDQGSASTVTNVPTQTIGQLNVISNTAITLQGSGTLTITGDAGDDLTVSQGCQLNISGAGAVIISLSSSAGGQVSGSMTFSGGGHRLLATASNGITFQTGGSFKAGSGFSGNPFGTTNLNSVVFASGSTYICHAGGNPFGATAPSSVVVFQPGSLYRIDAYAVPSFGGRTYGNFEMNYTGTITVTGSSAVNIENFTASLGTFYFNVTGNPGHIIKGNIFVSSLATMIFSPSSAGTVNINGTLPQTISGPGSLICGQYATMVIGNAAGVTLSMNADLNNLTISNGAVFTIAANASLTVEGDLINGAPASGFILESDGSLIHNTEGVQGIVRRNIAAADWGNWQDGWHFISSPVTSQAINEQSGFVTSGSGNDYDFYTWSEPGNAWINFKNTSAPPTFSSINGSTNFEPGNGYLAAYQQTGIKQFTGAIRVADLTFSNLGIAGTNANSGWRLLGNPFASPLTWYSDWNPVNIGGVAMVWNENGMSYSPVNAGEPIPAMNGFMIQVTGTPGSVGSLVMPASRRIFSAQSWYKSEETPVIRLFARNLDNKSCQESQIRFNPLATTEFDPGFDGRFLKGYAPVFYSKARDEHLMVNCLPDLNSQTSIPFDFIKNDGNRFEIEAEIKGDLPATVLLFDQKTGIEHNLTLDSVYVFTASPDDLPDRFLVTFSHVGQEEHPRKQIAIYSYGKNLYIKMKGMARIEVRSLAGKTVFSENINSSGMYQTTPYLATGCYLVKLTTNSTVYVKKVFIQS
ncbi:MAG: T9SS type A sorting domain-containing protein [Bacteroidetes bacterium]|nr:T9SS type A sorting domain-containing protein [Bacteroidota bacterium]